MGFRIGPPPTLDIKSVPGLRGWYRDNISTSGVNVTQWNDISGLGNHLNVGGGTNPTIVASDATIRSKPAIDFTGAQSLITSRASSSWFVNNSAYTAFIVNRYDSSNCGHPTTSGRLITAHGGNWYIPSRSCSPDTWVCHNSTFDVGVVYPPVGVWNIQSHRWNGTTIENRQVKGQYGEAYIVSTGALAAYTPSGASTMTIGGTNWDGRMAEIIFCNVYLDDVWLGLVYGYLRGRYGI